MGSSPPAPTTGVGSNMQAETGFGRRAACAWSRGRLWARRGRCRGRGRGRGRGHAAATALRCTPLPPGSHCTRLRGQRPAGPAPAPHPSPPGTPFLPPSSHRLLPPPWNGTPASLPRRPPARQASVWTQMRDEHGGGRGAGTQLVPDAAEGELPLLLDQQRLFLRREGWFFRFHQLLNVS